MDKIKKTTVKNISRKICTVIGVILCIVFGFLLICNLTIIIKGTIAPDKPPEIFGHTPLVVFSGSMSGDASDHIEVGDLIFVGDVESEDLKVGDIIAFMQGKTVVTHRIIEIKTGLDGKLLFSTKGDANNTKDTEPVSEDDLIGIYKARIPKVGDFAIFMQTPLGMIVFIGVPLMAFIIYDIIKRQRNAVKESEETAQLKAEVERLRALASENEK